MLKKSIFLLIAFCNIFIFFSQEEYISKFDKITPEKIIKDGLTLTENEKKALFNNEFTTAISNIPVNYIGNYASVDVTGTKASFATSFVRNGSVLGFNFSGATSDGTLKFINNNKINYNLNFGFQYHFIDASKKIKFNIDVSDLKAKRLKLNKTIADINEKIESILSGENLESLKKTIKELKNKIKEIDSNIKYINVFKSDTDDKLSKSIQKDALFSKINEIEEKIKKNKIFEEYIKNPDNSSLTYLKYKNIELNKIKDCFSNDCTSKKIKLNNDTEAKKIYLEKNSLKKVLTTLKEKYKKFSITNEKKELVSKKEILTKKLKKIISKKNKLESNKYFLESIERDKILMVLEEYDNSKIKTHGASFNWFSMGFKTSLKSFNLYDDKAALNDQITFKETFNAELTLQYSWHNQNNIEKWKSYLINSGLSITYGDNSRLLSPITLEDSNTISTTGNTTRITKNQTSVLVGEFKKDIAGAKVFTDIYYFLFNGNIAAFHFYPTVTFTQNQKTLITSEIGLLLSFKNKVRGGSAVNAELFYSLNDITNKFNSELNTFARNTLGLRLTIPIKFK